MQVDLPTPDTYPHALFGAVRKYDVHTGVDIYLPEGTPICALKSGVVIRVEWFTGVQSVPPTPWWHDTQAVWVLHNDGTVLVYGEVSSNLTQDQFVATGDIIGYVKTVLRKDKGRNPVSMLHVELYSQVPPETAVWELGQPCPQYLADPMPLLVDMRHRIVYTQIN